MKNKFIHTDQLNIENITTQTTAVISERSYQNSSLKLTFNAFDSIMEEAKSKKITTGMRFHQIEYLLQSFQLISKLTCLINRSNYRQKYSFFTKLKKIRNYVKLFDQQADSPKSTIEEFLQAFRKEDEGSLENEKLNGMIRDMYLDQGVTLIEKVIGRQIDRNKRIIFKNLRFFKQNKYFDEWKLTRFSSNLEQIYLRKTKLVFNKLKLIFCKQRSLYLLILLINNLISQNQIKQLNDSFRKLRNERFTIQNLVAAMWLCKILNFHLNLQNAQNLQKFLQNILTKQNRLLNLLQLQYQVQLEIKKCFSKPRDPDTGCKTKKNEKNIQKLTPLADFGAIPMRSNKKKRSSLLQSKFRSILRGENKVRCTVNQENQFTHLNLKAKLDQFVEEKLNNKKEIIDNDDKKVKQVVTNKSSAIKVMLSKVIILLTLGVVVAIIIHLTIGL